MYFIFGSSRSQVSCEKYSALFLFGRAIFLKLRNKNLFLIFKNICNRVVCPECVIYCYCIAFFGVFASKTSLYCVSNRNRENSHCFGKFCCCSISLEQENFFKFFSVVHKNKILSGHRTTTAP